MSTKELPRATLSQLLERAVPYERWRAPLDRRLQMLTLLAGAALLTQLLFLWLVPGLLRWSRSGFFLVLGGTLHSLLSWLAAHAAVMLLLTLAALGLYLMLVWRTRMLQAGGLTWHRVAFAEVAAGAASAFPVAVSLAIILLNLILWVLAICLFLSFIGLLLSGSGR